MFKDKKLLALFIVLTEILIVFITGIKQHKAVEPVTYDSNALFVSNGNTGSDDGGCYIDTGELYGKCINTPVTALKRGVYNVSLSYQTDTEPDSDTARSSVYLYRNRGRIQTDVVDVSGIRELSEYTFFVNRKSEVVVSTYLNTDKTAYFLLKEVTISYDRFKSTMRSVVLGIFYFGLLDMILLILVNLKSIISYFEKEKTKGLIWLSLGITLFLSCTPILQERLLHGDDIMFHLYRIEAMAKSMKLGNFPVYIQPYWMDGYGLPGGIFYPDVFLYPFAVLNMLGITVGSCYKLFILFTNAFALFCSYYAGTKITDNKPLAATGAIFYTLAGYRVIDLYKRSAVGEFSALTFLPLVVAGLYLIYVGKKKENDRGWLILAFGVSGIIYTHILSTMIVSIFCVIFALLNFKKTFSKNVFIELLKAIGAALVISAGQTVPFLSSLLRFAIQGTAADNNIAETGTLNLLAGLPTEETYWHYRSIFTLTGLSIAVLLIGIATLGAIALKKVECSKEHKFVLLNAVGISLIAIWLTSTWFPYNFLSEKVHLLYHLLQAVQFAWRYFVIATVLAWLMVLILPQIYSFKNLKALMVTVLILALIQSQYQFGHYMASEGYQLIYSDISAVNSFRQEGDEFIPEGSVPNMYDTEWDKPIKDEAVEVEEVYNAGDKLRIRVKNNTASDQSIQYPVFNWLYKVYLDGKKTQMATNGINNRATFEVPAGFDGTVDLKFYVPWYWTLAKLMSLAACLGVMALYIRERTKSKA